MKKKNMDQTFEVVCKSWDEYPKDECKRSFFELVYIVSGTGVQIFNNEPFDYQPGQMFLITPDDHYYFDIHTTTEFLFIRFNNVYLNSETSPASQLKRLEFILENATHKPGCILRNKADKLLVRSLAETITRELSSYHLFHNELVMQLVSTLIIVVARNISCCMPDHIRADSQGKIMAIIRHIQKYIYDPQQIKTSVIATKFALSEFYLGRYFKKHTGQNLQEYILNYKIRLIEIRLVHSEMRINEIAFELGFSDESHLVKFFRNNKGITPGQYRKMKQEMPRYTD
ncbi:MAG: AraC family transcriptional regulator [Bacteroides graminisolvens]|jgi:AraC-like DNA-binding protein|uniref:AraC family transcriptional regulator n=1 Tax=Bacteroides graminisolvens TaxID=477666 RepID=UPI003A885C97